MAKLGLEARMTIVELARRGMSGRAIARALEVTEGTIRHHLRRRADGAVDGRSRQEYLAAGWGERIADWLAACERQGGAVNLAELHEWLVEECGYPGSLRSVQRYVAARFARPKLRARRRVETPPGAHYGEHRVMVSFGGEPVLWPDSPSESRCPSLHNSYSVSSHARRSFGKRGRLGETAVGVPACIKASRFISRSIWM